MPQEKTHFRKAFDSPYLSSADIVGPTVLTISHCTLEIDRTKKSKDYFNTAHFAEKELRPGEKLKPMILNATNCNTLRKLCDSHYIDDWQNVSVTIFVEQNVRFGKETVEGLRISPKRPEVRRPDPVRDALIQELYTLAIAGIDPLKEKWTALTPAQRKSVGTAEWDRIKAAADQPAPAPAEVDQ